MGYPVWITPAGDLGKIAELEYYSLLLQAYDPDAPYNITVSAAELGRDSAVTNQWTIAGGIIQFRGTGIPYHSFSNTTALVPPTIQDYDLSWSWRGGINKLYPNPSPVYPGAIGLWLNGVAMFSPGANRSWLTGFPSPPRGFTVNLRYPDLEGMGLDLGVDLAGGFATPGGFYHYMDYEFADSWLNGDGVITTSPYSTGVAEADVIPYLAGSLVHADGHSKILGFSLDGYPVYGPYGYDDPEDEFSSTVRMATGYALKNSNYRQGTTAEDLIAWPMGIFLEDYEYVGGGDLDEHNGRWCKTPDYPYGTYAYFCTVDEYDMPVYPYVIGNTYREEAARFEAFGQLPLPQNKVLRGLGIPPVTNIFLEQKIFFELLAGRLPPGIQLSEFGTMEGQAAEDINVIGTPTAVNSDRDFTFTIRARGGPPGTPLITDRTFKLTVTGNKPPQIITGLYGTPPVSIGDFLDGEEMLVQLEAVDLDFDPLVWQLIEGVLPTGLTFSDDGVISGVPVPFVELPEGALPGYDEQRFSIYPFQFPPYGSQKSYAFTVSVTDGKEVATRRLSMTVYPHDSFTADTISTSVDEVLFTTDIGDMRPPVIVTKSLGTYASFVSDNYFAYKIDAIDLDGDRLEYVMVNDGSTAMVPGLSINIDTGWITGYITEQIEPSIDYTITIMVYKADYPTYMPDVQSYTLTVLGSESLDITWTTGADLGTIKSGTISQLFVSATSNSGKSLLYTINNGSRLPQGLKLLSDGTISGRSSFQGFTLDGSLANNTTFDKDLVTRGFLLGQTSFDCTYTLTVTAITSDGAASSEKTFTLRLDVDPQYPYENVYLRCITDQTGRSKYSSIVENTDIFVPSSIYRPNDPYWGKKRQINVMAAYGITVSSAAEYIAAMGYRHYNKRLYFDGYGTAVAKDANDNIMYEVVYVKMIEDTRAYVKGVKQEPPKFYTDLYNVIPDWFNTVSPNSHIIAPNDSQLMRRDLANVLGSSSPLALPEWMRSVQADGTVLNFVTYAVLAYVKPGEGEKVLFRLNRAQSLGEIPKMNEIDFVADRYVLDATLSINYDTANDKFYATHYTSFDVESTYGNNPVATVDFAVDIPFNYINGRTAQFVQDLGGLDGITTSYDGKIIVFATQENYDATKYTVDPYDQGWRDVDSTIIPISAISEDGSTVYSPRKSAWIISVGEGDILTLTPYQELYVDDEIQVRYGFRYGGNYMYLDPVYVDPATTPYWVIVDPIVITVGDPTTFDSNSTRFRNNVDIYQLPGSGDVYLKFPKDNIYL